LSDYGCEHADYFQMARNPTSIDGKWGDHFLQANLSVPILSYDRAEIGNSKIHT